jgi:KDO2-lipid IV(A) lauroyltransferase
MKGRVVDAAYAAGWATVRGIPEWVGRSQFDAIADTVWARRGKSVRRLEANLRRVLGPAASRRELHRVTHEGVRSYLRYWYEVFRLPALSQDEVRDRFTLLGSPLLESAVTSGRGAVVTLPHMGNWDLAGAWLVASGSQFTTVAERLEPASLFDRFVAFRESLGMEVLALTGGAQPPYGVLRERLLAGGIVCLLGDRDLTASGVEVDFFGEPARMPAGPAALALDTGAALLPATLWFSDRRRSICQIWPEVVPPATGSREEKVGVMTQRAADAFAGSIAEHPADWHMLQRVWVADLDPARRRQPTRVPA